MRISDPEYNLAVELIRALSLAVEKGLDLSKALDQCGGEVEEMVEACIQLLIESKTLVLGAAELLKKHYAFPAEVLLRTIVDRVSTVQYIAQHGEEGLKNWRSNKLPPLAERVSSLFDFSEDEINNVIRPHVKKLHKSTHGDAARWMVNVGLESGKVKYWLGPNPTRPEQCESVAMLLLPQLKIIGYFVNQLTKEITTS
jgi:hypothetical protein